MSSSRANDLAIRLEQGAAALAAFASGLTDIDWGTRQPHDGRTIGVIVHHVASQYPIEMQLAQMIASGKAIEGITSETVDRSTRSTRRSRAARRKRRRSRCCAATARRRRPRSARSPTSSSIAPCRCRCTATRR